MTMTANGLAKLNEEIGELLKETGKKLAYFRSTLHPDGAGPLNERIGREIADLEAAMDFVVLSFGLNVGYVERRTQAQLTQYRVACKLSARTGGIARLQGNMGTLLIHSSALVEGFDSSSLSDAGQDYGSLTMAIADVKASLAYVKSHFDLNETEIEARRGVKLALFIRWSEDETNGTDSFHCESAEA